MQDGWNSQSKLSSSHTKYSMSMEQLTRAENSDILPTWKYKWAQTDQNYDSS